MRILAAAVGLLFLAAAPAAVAGPFEDAVLAQINHARADPAAYARSLERAAARSDDGYGGGWAEQDPQALDEAIDFLMRERPLPPLKRDRRIAVAASEHVAVQGPRGDVGHGPVGSLGRRLQGEGVWAGLEAEAISYGQPTPADVVRQLVVDSGVPGRGHRMDIFGRHYQLAGVACGPHAAWGAMCVIDFAGAIVRR